MLLAFICNIITVLIASGALGVPSFLSLALPASKVIRAGTQQQETITTPGRRAVTASAAAAAVAAGIGTGASFEFQRLEDRRPDHAAESTSTQFGRMARGSGTDKCPSADWYVCMQLLPAPGELAAGLVAYPY